MYGNARGSVPRPVGSEFSQIVYSGSKLHTGRGTDLYTDVQIALRDSRKEVENTATNGNNGTDGKTTMTSVCSVISVCCSILFLIFGCGYGREVFFVVRSLIEFVRLLRQPIGRIVDHLFSVFSIHNAAHDQACDPVCIHPASQIVPRRN